MSTLYPNSQLTFLELSKSILDKGMIDIAEVMNANQGRILEDIPWYECNQILSEKVARRATLPHGTWRKVNSGVAKEAASKQVAVEPTALLEARSEIDEALVDNAPNPVQFRRNEDLAFVEGLSQEFAKTLIWGTTEGSAVVAPEEIVGLQQRLAALSLTTVVDNGGTTASTLTSIYVVNWGRNTVYCIYPAAAAKRGKLGLSTVDKGTEPCLDASDNKFYAYVTQFKWYVGLAVKDELAIGRVPNIDITSGSGKYTFDEDKLIEVLNLGHFEGPGTRIYMNKTIATQGQIRLKDKSNVNWSTSEGLGGLPIMTFSGVPCRRLDNNIILNTEEVVA